MSLFERNTSVAPTTTRTTNTSGELKATKPDIFFNERYKLED